MKLFLECTFCLLQKSLNLHFFLLPAELQTEHQNEKERWFKWLWMYHGWHQTGWSGYFRNFYTVYTELKRSYLGENALLITRLLQADRKATASQIITLYHQGMEESISKCTTYWKLKQQIELVLHFSTLFEHLKHFFTTNLIHLFTQTFIQVLFFHA